MAMLAVISHLYQSTLAILLAMDVIYMREQAVSSSMGLSCNYHWVGWGLAAK